MPEPLTTDQRMGGRDLETFSGTSKLPERPVISVVVPAYNEEHCVLPLVEALRAVLDGVGESYEVILVDDGSSDGTWTMICEAHAADPRVKGLSLSRNFGHQHALLAGLSHAAGDAIVLMDGDLQHPPEVIPTLLAAWREGYLVVSTERRDSTDTTAFKRITSRGFYHFFSAISGLELRAGSADFRLLDRQVVDVILQLRDPSLFFRGVVQWVGFPAATVPYTARPRVAGKTKYSVRKMLRFSAAAVLSFSTLPLRVGIWVGLVMSGLALAEVLYVLVVYSRGQTVPGWASMLVLMSIMLGVLFILVGILGAYVAAIYDAVRARPRFIERAGVGCEVRRDEAIPTRAARLP
jgi:polyisoprenyl-phosphate glycosyltransferase